MPTQLTIFLDDSGNLRAELPAINGLRRKVDIPWTANDTTAAIRRELVAERDRLKAKERAANVERHNRIFAIDTERHGVEHALKFIGKPYGSRNNSDIHTFLREAGYDRAEIAEMERKSAIVRSDRQNIEERAKPTKSRPIADSSLGIEIDLF